MNFLAASVRYGFLRKRMDFLLNHRNSHVLYNGSDHYPPLINNPDRAAYQYDSVGVAAPAIVRRDADKVVVHNNDHPAAVSCDT